jgi:hypothetical protein
VARITWPVDFWHNVRKDRHELKPCANLGALSGALTIFEAHFSAQGPFFRSIFWHNLLFRRDFWQEVLVTLLKLVKCSWKNRFFNGFAPKLKKMAQAQSASVPAIVGRNARLRAYTPDTMLGPARCLGRSAEGD